MNCWREQCGLPRCREDETVITLDDRRQKNGWTCGRVAIEIVWDYLGLGNRSVPSTPLDGTSPDTLESVLWQSGVTVQSGSMDLADLQYHTRRGRPVICAVTEESGEGHWVVVAGVRHGKVYFQCPLDGPCKEAAQQFEMRWQDHTRRGVVYTQWGVACGPGG
jgi:ABC-type bacteriocin/lantibiotic exporter with double-glycine peptidase domain